VLDQAGWHGSQALEPIEGLTLIPLPAYSPELQPVERVWPLVDEPLANPPSLRSTRWKRCWRIAACA
jgi:transposase